MTSTPEHERPEHFVAEALIKYRGYAMSTEVDSIVAALRAAGLLGGDPTDALRIDDDYQHIYWQDPVEGCWVAYRRADCVGEEELPERRLAAAGVATQETGEVQKMGESDLPPNQRSTHSPSSGREELIAALRHRAHLEARGAQQRRLAIAELLRHAAAALAAPPVVDEEKLAEEISRHKLVHVSVSRKSAFCRCNSSVKSGTDDNLAWFEAHRARAVIEWWEKQGVGDVGR